MNEKPIIRKLSEQDSEQSIGGIRRQLIHAEDDVGSSLYHISVKDMQPHFHIRTTEIYYILKGTGVLRLDQEEFEIESGMAVAIPPGILHELTGDVELLILATPPLQPDDKFIK